ncbi:replication-associated recombination protein A [Sinanaerobacter sp. ZZT-01]|uniref:replication-associated recombination protein A n=1 Tax=Sinanaerobacter sp. ZZT-01 TaxID=3111540 RepID=UPI002D799945|nr:replication-associated recombination protein A [Sinanaerobacter sp. ZZT-01]WRR92913.1 replication-associated recombination protein A [Sinanaerobacter sp. ZZT-01]
MIPLSTRMRPKHLDEFFGQQHFLYKDSLLYNAIKNKTFDSAIFFGPSGTGKTTLARIVAREMDAEFYELNASSTGIKELKEIIEKSKLKFFGLQKQTTYVYVDEFHRWNKLQQDSLLQALEEGVIRFIGSTTENPYFAVNNAILSRVRLIYEFKALDQESLFQILKRTMTEREKGLGNLNLKWDEEALYMLADRSGGDARVALDTLGFIAENINASAKIDLKIVGEAMQRQTSFYDKSEDKYNLLSALQKSIRGSDPDAAIHYLARLMQADADILMIGRRLMVIASEDVGLAYPSAISIVTSCIQASQMVGYPEAQIILSQAVLLLASCPKSNSSILAVSQATEDLKRRKIKDVPSHLKDSHYKGAKERGLGQGYQYPHNFGGYVKQQYLPDDLYKDQVTYYHPTQNGKENAFKKFLETLEKKER